MYLLSCPNCQSDLAVTPAQAGDRVQCSNCQNAVAVPKLGELKRLPLVEQAAAQEPSRSENSSFGSTAVFVVFSLIALATLLAGGYNAVRWAAIPSQITTEDHLEQLEQAYGESEPALMIVEFEEMESRPFDLLGPYQYQEINDEKARWGRNALIALGITLASAAVATFAVSRGRERSAA